MLKSSLVDSKSESVIVPSLFTSTSLKLVVIAPDLIVPNCAYVSLISIAIPFLDNNNISIIYIGKFLEKL